MDINLNNGGNKMCFLFLASYKWICSDLLLLIRCFIFYYLVLGLGDFVKYFFFVSSGKHKFINFIIFFGNKVYCWIEDVKEGVVGRREAAL